MPKLDFQLNEFERGYFVCMTVSTQCTHTVSVKFSQGSSTLISANKTDSSSALKVVDQGNTTVTATGQTLTVEVPKATKLDHSKVAGLIMDDQSRRVGFIYDYCVEIGDNEKMDDIYINIVGWAKKG